jgi:hypothetical protein
MFADVAVTVAVPGLVVDFIRTVAIPPEALDTVGAINVPLPLMLKVTEFTGIP